MQLWAMMYCDEVPIVAERPPLFSPANPLHGAVCVCVYLQAQLRQHC